MPVNLDKPLRVQVRVDWERLNAALGRASYAVSRMSEALRETVWGREDAMRWTPPPDGDAEEVPRWLA